MRTNKHFHGYLVEPNVALPIQVQAALETVPGVRWEHGQLRVPTNAYTLVHNVLGSIGVGHTAQNINAAAWKDSVSFHELRDFVPGMLTDYQQEGIAFALTRPGSHLWWPCGAGKTLGAIVWAVAAGGPIVAVTRAAARRTWELEVQKYSHLAPYIWKPASLKRKKDRWADLGEYLVWCAEEGRRPFVIVAWETLQSALADIRKLKPTSVIYDEAHRGKSHKRWQAVTREDGGVKFSKRENMTSAAMDISRLAKRRLCTTATPVRNRLRDLWAQLDLAEPALWGAFYPWASRYCGSKPGRYGGIDTTGQSNTDELQQRLNAVAHVVPYATTHAQLPPKRRQVTYLPVEDQQKPAAMKRDIARASKVGGSALLEVMLCEAASRKRGFILDLAKDHLHDGEGKVIIFTGRRKDAEQLAASVQKATGAQVWMGHGDTPAPVRDEIREQYMASDGPCVLVGTGDAWGESLNLQDTDALILAQLPYTPGQVVQWEGRVARLGQKRPVIVHYVVAEGTVDERVAALLLEKLPAVEAVVGDGVAGQLHSELSGAEHEADLVASMLSKIGADDVDQD